MKKIIYTTVIYPCKNFNSQIRDYLNSVNSQTNKSFKLLLILDRISKKDISNYLKLYLCSNIKIKIFESFDNLNPIELRKKQINLSYKYKADILIFSDFDDVVQNNRVEKILKYINNYDFVFNDFHISDQSLNKIYEQSFFARRKIPKIISDFKKILHFNYIGYGSLAINLNSFDYNKLFIPKNILALDWYIVSKVLFYGGKGAAVYETCNYYRQHKNSLVGFNFKLNLRKLKFALKVKTLHYFHLKRLHHVFNDSYNIMIKLTKYIKKYGKKKYINIINSNFDTSNFCWWENIKSVSELENYETKS